MTIEDGAGVEMFLAALSAPGADDASVEHLGRPREVDPDEGDEVCDHVLYVTVHDSWVYLRYLGPVAEAPPTDDAVVPVGDPTSPEAHGTNNVDYLSGTGLPPEVATQALTEFLATEELPACIRWITEEDLHAGRSRVLVRSAS